MTGHDAETVLRPTPGEGLLARAGDLVLLCRPTPEDDAQQLLQVLEGVAGQGGNGWNLVKRLTRAIFQMTDPPALVAYGPTEEGQAVLVHGLATALVRTTEGEIRLDGAEAVTWADRVLHGVVAITASLGANPPGAVSTSVRLDDGVVPAGGFALTDDDSSAPMAALPEPAEPVAAAPEREAGQPAAATGPQAAAPAAPQPPAATAQQPAVQQPPAAPEQPAAPAAAAPPQAPAAPEPPAAPAEPAAPQQPAAGEQYGADGSVLVPGRAAPPPPAPEPEEPAQAGELPFVPAIPDEPAAPPLPEEPAAAPPPLGDVPEEPAAEQPQEAGSPEVLGIYCKNDHFNDPEALYCGVCGISMAQQTHVAQPGKRPPLGVLVLDDGATFQLDTTYIIGREPEPHQDVQRGHASAVRVQDPDALVSRAHAMVTLDGWNVQLVDLGSANGTFVLAQGATEWTQLHPHYRTTITPGSRIAIGRRGFLYESHRKF